jgi:hypothetical protein
MQDAVRAWRGRSRLPRAGATPLQSFTRLCGSDFTPDCLVDDKRDAKGAAKFRCAAAILEKGSFIEPNSKFDATALNPGI